ncbi:MAG: signal recognition particle-docking protein FtsY [Eubacterium sp.]|jgi:fused signal recognition particle receptor|nr:signal recognition particle-docking protein FtsY [Eubacterium sp.]
MGLFDKIKQGLQKTKESFAERIGSIIKSFQKVDEDFFEQLEETLILSDIGAATASDICDKLRGELKKLKEVEVDKVIICLKNIIAEMILGENEIELSTKPTVIMVIGVNGAGKTTSIGKLAANYKSGGKKVMVVAADTFRAAAIEQLSTWTKRAGVDIIKHAEGSDPAAVVFDGCKAAVARGIDVLIIDTAGRLHNKKHLMDELKKMARIVSKELPESKLETLLVLDSTTGQNAVSQARLFNETSDVTGIILTKLDGTAKGGIIISIKNELNIPVKFVGVGEKLDDLEPFSAESFVEALFEGVNLMPMTEDKNEKSYNSDK